MISYFPKLGSKGKDVQGLLTKSITLLGKDADIFKPAVYMTIIKSIRIVAIFYALHCFFVSQQGAKGFLAVVLIVFLAPVVSFLSMRFKAITSWMVYEILQGKDTDVHHGSKEVKGIGFSLFLYSILDLLITTARVKKNENGKTGLAGLVLNIFKEVWDLVKNFTLPALVIDKTSLKEVPNQLKKVKKNIPGTLAGVIGVDVVGNVFISIFTTIQTPILILSAAMGHYGNEYLPQSWLLKIPGESDTVVNSLPFFIMFFASSILVAFLNSLVHLVKTTYFTTFYTSLSRPDDIHDDLKGDITNYLNYNDRLDGYKFFDMIPKDEQGHDLDEVSGEDLKLIRKISNTFTKNVNKGLSEKRIYQALLNKGYSKEQLKAGFQMYKGNKAA